VRGSDTEPDYAYPLLLYRHVTGASQYEIEHELDEEMLNAYLANVNKLLDFMGDSLMVKLAPFLMRMI
jgi:hypothetical protein